MKVDVKKTVTLSSEDVNEAISFYLMGKGFGVKSIEYRVDTGHNPTSPAEDYIPPHLKSVIVDVESLEN